MNATLSTFLIELFPKAARKARTSGPHIAVVDAFGATVACSDVLPESVCRWLSEPYAAELSVELRFKTERERHLAKAEIRGAKLGARVTRHKNIPCKLRAGDTLALTWTWRGIPVPRGTPL